MCAQLLSGVQLFATPWSIACQAPLCMEFSRQECWSGLSFPSPGDLPDQGVKPMSPALADGFFTTEEAHIIMIILPINGKYVFKSAYILFL